MQLLGAGYLGRARKLRSEEELEHYLDLLDVQPLVDALDDQGRRRSTKPEPDLVKAALEKVDGAGR